MIDYKKDILVGGAAAKYVGKLEGPYYYPHVVQLAVHDEVTTALADDFGNIRNSGLKVTNKPTRTTMVVFANVYPDGSLGRSRHNTLQSCKFAKRTSGPERSGIVAISVVSEDGKVISYEASLVWTPEMEPAALPPARNPLPQALHW